VAVVPVVELSITDDYQLGSLQSFLRRELTDVSIDRFSSAAEPDSLGWVDGLTLTFAGVSAFADAVGLIKSYLDSHSKDADVTIIATKASKRITKTLEVRNATSDQVKDFADWLSHD
jgi:hypothetical protein